MKNLFVLLFILIGTLSATAQYSSKAKESYASRYGFKISGGAIVTRPEITFIGNEQDYVVHQVELSNSSPQFAAGLWGQKDLDGCTLKPMPCFLHMGCLMMSAATLLMGRHYKT